MILCFFLVINALQHGKATNILTVSVPAGTINEQDVLRQSLHELLIDPLLASAMPSQVSAICVPYASLGKTEHSAPSDCCVKEPLPPQVLIPEQAALLSAVCCVCLSFISP